MERVSVEEIRICMSQRGTPKLLCRGYSYNIDKGLKNCKKLDNWRCSFQYKKCRAKVFMESEYSFILKGVHNHPPVVCKQVNSTVRMDDNAKAWLENIWKAAKN